MRSRTIKHVRTLIPAVLVAVMVCAGTALPAPLRDYEIVSQDESHITFTVRLPRYEIEDVMTGGTAYSTIVADGLTPIADAGEPDIPAFAVMLAVPQGVTVRLESFLRSGVTVLEGVRVIPVARLEARGEGANRFADNIFDEDKSIYDSVSPFPADQVWVTDRGRMRHQDVVRVFVSPFIYEPGRERLTVTREITVTIGFEGRVRLGGAPPVEDRWERVYQDVLANYEHGRRWRARRAPLPMKSTVANDRLKILIEKTGMHKLAFDSLSAVGFPEGVAVDEILIYRDEFYEGSPDSMELVESAIELSDNDEDGFFSSGDEVVFYGNDLRDQFGYRGSEDMFFDYNVYWLSWGAGPHERIGSRSGWREDSAPSMPEHFRDILHMEEDIVFSNFPPLNPAYEEYDYFYWERYLASFPFDLPGVHPDYPCSLVVNFISYYNDPYGKTKIGDVDILGQGCAGMMDEIATRSLYAPGHVRGFYEIDAGFFCDTDNVFRIESSLSSTWTPGHTVDWFEIIYEREFEAHEDVLAFTNGGMSGELQFEIGGFSTSDIMLYDISDPVAPVRLDVPPENIVDSGGAFSITFRDSLGEGAGYFSHTGSDLVEIGMHQLSLVGPPPLRDITASYVVISHPDFTAELAPLIAKREEQGHTTLLATTEEVYDDFGNGMKSDLAIKRFIKHSFFNGGTEFVLLVGDANVDRKGKLNVQQPGQARSDIDYLPSHNMILYDLLTQGNPEIRPSDNWFVMADGADDLYPDLYIGRLSVGSANETAGVITKILNFENDPGGDSWKKRMVLIADDEFGTNYAAPRQLCHTGQWQFEAACESTAVIAGGLGAVPVDTVKHYLERCLVNDQPSIREANGCPDYSTTLAYTSSNCTSELVQDLNAGAFMVNFQGHANRWQFTHEQILYDFNPRKDVLGLTNRMRPFIFIGFGCWISDFQWLAEPILTDAIGEKFLLNPNGAACASFASGCSEPISHNQVFNRYVTRAFFTHLQGMDAHGAPIPARILIGEALMTALLRYGHVDYIDKHILLGDPAMVVDLGPPLISTSIDGMVVDESYVYEGETLDTLRITTDIRDEEAITEVAIELVEDDVATSVSPDDYTETALLDTGFLRSRAYMVTYDHVPVLGDYVVRTSGTDYADKISSFDIHITTGSAGFFADGKALGDGGKLVFGQQLEVLITRPVVFGEDDIEVRVDSVSADEYEAYSVEMKDGEGKQWQVSFIPSLAAGEHYVHVSVQGFGTRHRFEYVPAQIEFFVNDKPLYDGDYVSPRAEFEIMLKAETDITEDDVEVELDAAPVAFAFAPDSSGWRLTFDLDLSVGDHELSVTLFSVSLTATFTVSAELMLTDVSAFPNPFSSEVYFFYTLSQEVREVNLSIFTVSGRLIRETRMTPFVGYNEFMWDGRDDRGDRVANGTYLYRVIATSSSGEKEFTGWVVKLE